MRIRSLAVLSIAAVSFLIGCNNDADNKFIDQANKAIESEKNNITTPSSAVTYAYEKGVDINGYTLKKTSNNIAFDIDTKQFTIMNGDNVTYAPKGYKKNSNTYHIFKFSDVYDSRSTYSQYLTRNFAGSDLLVVTTGLDMGENNNVKNITYFNSTDTEKDILLNVSCDYLNISTTKDNIYHYGSSNNVFIPSTLSGSYHEYGSCCYIQAAGGNVYLESGSYSDLFEIPNGSSVNIKQSEGSNILMRVNADSVRAQSTAKIKEINDPTLTANTIQSYLDNTEYNFYRLTTEARDIVLKEEKSGETVTKEGYIQFKRDLFFDLNGRSITFDCGQSKGVQYDGDSTPYYPGILVKGDSSINAFLVDTQSSLYPRSGINLLDCSIIVEGSTDANKPVNFYMNSGKIHDVKCTSNLTGSYRNRPAVLVMGNVSNTDRESERHSAFYMYGGYIKTEWGSKADTVIKTGDTWRKHIACKCIQPRGNGAIVNMIYGDLDSFHYCISCQGTAAPNVDRYGKTVINITGGYLTGGKEPAYDDGTHESTGYNYTPLFFPQAGEVNITGATITGPSCINAKAGTINIYGGVFNAIGDNPSATAGDSGSAADGSVIFMESNRYYQGAIDVPLNINIKYATMTSKNAYIIKNSGYVKESKFILSKASVTVEDGVFNYKKDKYASDLTESYKDYFECSINGGTWNQIA